MIRILLSTFLLSSYSLLSQGIYPVGARSVAMGSASLGNEDIWAYFQNPGALGFVTSGGAGISYQNRFAMKELQSQGIAFVQPLKTGVISIGAQNYGYQTFKSYRVGAGYSLKLAENLSAGVQLNYQGIRLPEYYGSENTVTAEFGFLARVNESWKIGFSVFNLGRTKLSDFEDDRLSTLFRLGTTYTISKKLFFTVEANKDVDSKIQFRGGMEYEALKNFYLRAGISSNPTELSFGMGYKWKKIQLDAASNYHQVLGFSPAISFTYSFEPRPNE